MTNPYHPRNALYIALLVSLGGLLFGFDASVVSGVVGFVVPEFSLDEIELGLLVAAPTIGGFVSGISAGPIADYVGRKRVLLVLAALYTLSAIGSALAPNYETLLFARALGGVAFASLGIAPLYIAEIAPYDRRGFLVSLNQFNIVIGFSIAYFANFFILQISQLDVSWVTSLGIDRFTWRWMFGLEILPAVFWFVALCFVPETPRWLALNNREPAARKVLERIRPAERVAATLENIRQLGVDVGQPFLQRIAEVFGPRMRLALLVGVTIGVIQQVTGINAILFYAPTIFEQSGVGTNAAFAQAALVGVINVVFTIVAMILIDRLGRKPLLIIGLLGIVISMGITAYGFQQATYQLDTAAIERLDESIDRAALAALVDEEFADDLAFKRAAEEALGAQAARNSQADLVQAAISLNATLVLAGLLGFVASFALSLGPVMWVLFSEIFPARVRGIALAISMVFNSVASFVVQLLFPWQLANMGNAVTFYIFAALGVFGVLVVQWLLPETKGKTLEELETVMAQSSRFR
ncbi:MAG: MFS transporter [Pseudomonadota bacterium]